MSPYIGGCPNWGEFLIQGRYDSYLLCKECYNNKDSYWEQPYELIDIRLDKQDKCECVDIKHYTWSDNE